jgi:undecaprenyl diphosphate synthase
LPNVDLIVRTGIENDPHLSGNVLMWQADYAQLYFTETLYPEFTTQELGLAIADYKSRMRRQGK